MATDEFQTGLQLHKSSPTNENVSPTPYESKRGGLAPQVRPPHGSADKTSLNDLDQKILKLLPNGHYCKSLARALKVPRSTIRYRLKKLRELGIIVPERHNIADNSSITYAIAQGWGGQSSKGGVIKPVQNAPFSAHATCWRFPFIRGGQPKSAFPQKLKHCTLYRFYEECATIISTPKSLLIHVKVDLGADTIDNLNAKYLEIARSVANKYAQRFNLSLGTPTKSGKTHYALKGMRISELIKDRGTFETAGFIIDNSHGEAHIETKDEELAKAFEFTLTKLPRIVGNMDERLEGLQGMMRSGITQQSAVNNLAYIIGNFYRDLNEVKEKVKSLMPSKEAKH